MSLPDIPDLEYECRYCQNTDVVPVLDRGIEQAPKAGNKYRRHCLNCWRWLPMCSASYFRMHNDPHVLPVGAEPERENIVPLDVYRENNGGESISLQRPSDATEDEEGDQDGSFEKSHSRTDGGKLREGSCEIHMQFFEHESRVMIAMFDTSGDVDTPIDEASLERNDLDTDDVKQAWEDAVLKKADFIRSRRRGWNIVIE